MRVGSFIVKRSTICVLRNEWSPAEPRIPIIRWDGYLWMEVMRRNVSSCRDFGTIRRSGPALGRWRLKRILSGKDFTTHPQTESHLWWCMKWVEFLLGNLGFQKNYVVLEKLIELRSRRWEQWQCNGGNEGQRKHSSSLHLPESDLINSITIFWAHAFPN